jgi:thymidylate synthase
MKTLRVRNVQEALPRGLQLLRDEGEKRPSRNGSVHVHPEPVTTLYERPDERVIFYRERDANPFFHLFESIWMLAGRNDLKFVESFAKNMRSYSDDGKTMWGAYGWRWRSFFEHPSRGNSDHQYESWDQLSWAIDRLKKDKTDRRVVINMWAGPIDQLVADSGGKDVPCNLSLKFEIGSDGALNMYVFNRSNDIVWGAYGANAVHMSILQEYVAGMVEVPIGRYWQVSTNYHAYDDTYDKCAGIREMDEFAIDNACPYRDGLVKPTRLFSARRDPKLWDQDMALFFEDPSAVGFVHPFWRKCAVPMWMAHRHYKKGEGEDRFLGALEILDQMPDNCDWKFAARDWIEQRHRRWRSKNG